MRSISGETSDKMFPVRKWITKVLQEGDHERLEGFRKKGGDLPLEDILDRSCFHVIASLREETLLQLKEHYPKVLERISLEDVLYFANETLLEWNKEQYLKREDFLTVLENIFMLRYEEEKDLSYLDERYLTDILKVLAKTQKWIGKLPEIYGADAVLSQAESELIPEGRSGICTSLRKLLDRNTLYLQVLDEKYVRMFDLSKYEYVNMPVPENGYEIKAFLFCLQNVEKEKLVVENEAELLGRKFCTWLLEESRYQTELQECICSFYEGRGRLEALYSFVTPELLSAGGFETIVARFFHDASQKDVEIPVD